MKNTFCSKKPPFKSKNLLEWYNTFSDQFPQLYHYEKIWVICELANIPVENYYQNILNSYAFNNFKLNYITYNLSLNIPLPLILGHIYYNNHRYYLGPGCFIPRNDSSYLVKIISDYIAKINLKPTVIYEPCCNVGNLGIELNLKYKNSKLYGSDINQLALKYAHFNAKFNGLNNFQFYQEDFLKTTFNTFPDKVNVCVFNPPYITYKEKNQLASEVLKYNPPYSLFSGDTTTIFYEKLIKNINKFVAKKFIIGMEINYQDVANIKKLLEKYCHNLNYFLIKNINQDIQYVIIFS